VYDGERQAREQTHRQSSNNKRSNCLTSCFHFTLLEPSASTKADQAQSEEVKLIIGVRAPLIATGSMSSSVYLSPPSPSRLHIDQQQHCVQKRHLDPTCEAATRDSMTHVELFGVKATDKVRHRNYALLRKDLHKRTCMDQSTFARYSAHMHRKDNSSMLTRRCKSLASGGKVQRLTR